VGGVMVRERSLRPKADVGAVRSERRLRALST